MKSLFLLPLLLLITIVIFSCSQGEIKENKEMVRIKDNDTIYIIAKPGYMFDIKVYKDISRKTNAESKPEIFTFSGSSIKNSSEEITYSFKTGDSSFRPVDTSHIFIEYPSSGVVQVINCTDGDSVVVPCPSEPDGVLYVMCVDSAVYICNDTEENP
jgi:hypothetical protein